MSGKTLEAKIQGEIRKRLKRTQGQRERAVLLRLAGHPDAEPAKPAAKLDEHGRTLEDHGRRIGTIEHEHTVQMAKGGCKL